MINRFVRHVVAAGATVVLAPSLGAQGVIVTGSSSARYVDMRPLVADSVTVAETDSVSELYRRTQDGIYVKCLSDGYCRFQRSGTPQSLVALMQDIDIAAWGFGQGISAHAQLRARSAVGDARDLWPQATETFEAISAYLELDRERLRVRAGRQWLGSSFGFFNFDGASLLVRPWLPLTLEGYGGWGLVQGLNQPITDEAVEAVEAIAPDKRTYLFGGAVRYRPSARGAVRVQYQREIRTDRAALHAERFAVDGDLRFGPAVASAEFSQDVATGDVNEARLRVQSPLSRQFDASLQVRRYSPFFELWTIWGAFDPTGYDEARGELRWSPPDNRLAFGVHGAWRRYQESDAGFGALPLRDDGWRVGAIGTVRPLSALTFEAAYSLDVGFGSSRSDAELAVRWSPNDRLSLGAHGVAFQNIYEFRIGSGRVIGGGLDLGFDVLRDLRLVADAMIYRNTVEDQPAFANWNQKRGSIRLEWTLGREPGLAATDGRLP